MKLDVTIASPQRTIFKDQAYSVIMPGESGVFEVLAFHKPLLTRLISGDVIIDNKAFPISRGIAKVGRNAVTVLVEVE